MPEDRYSRAADILELALELQASHAGLTLDEIAERRGTSRRTAARLRDAVERLFPDLRAETGPDKKKRWRIPKGAAASLIRWQAEELAGLETALKIVRREGRPDQARALERVATKLKGILENAAHAARVAPDLEALEEAEGLAARVGPRPAILREVMDRLRYAIITRQKIRLRYTRRDGERVRHKLYPYGFLYGSRHYLVAWSRPAGKHLLYRLPDVEEVEVLEGESFERDPGFDIERFAANAFGVFQERPVDVVWRFAREVARDARRFRFHPEQETRPLPDGRLEVRFRAGGQLEMAWHLFTWGPHVEVVRPRELRELLVGELRRSLGAHA